MSRLWLLGAGLLLAGCIDFEQKLRDCDAGLGACAPQGDGGGASDGGGALDAGTFDAGPDTCPGFRWNGWCWVNPTPLGEDLASVAVRGPDEVWVAGRTGVVMRWDGQRWSDARFGAGITGLDPSGDIRAIAPTDAGPIVVGDGVTPRLWNGAGWERLTASHDLDDSVLTGVTSTRSGRLVAVGNHEFAGGRYGLSLEGPLTDLRPYPYADAGILTAVYAWPGTDDVWRAGWFSDGFGIITPDGGVVMLPTGDVTREQDAVQSMWSGPANSVWYAAGGCRIGRINAMTGAASHASSCNADLSGGWWVPQLQRHVLVGQDSTIYEDTDAVLVDGGQPLNQVTVDNLGAGPSFNLRSVAFAPSSDFGVAVGEAGKVLLRTDGGWRYAGSPVRGHLRVGAVSGASLLVGAGDKTLVRVPLAGGAPTQTTPRPGEAFITAVWSDGKVSVAADDDGLLCRLTAEDLCESVPLAQTPVALNTVWGSSAEDLWGAGDAGYLGHTSPAGWVEVPLQFDGGQTSFVGGARGPNGAWLAAQVAGAQGALYRVERDGGLVLAASPKAVTALAVSPSGTVWLAGLERQVYSLPPDGGPLRAEQLQNVTVRNADFTAILARDDSDVWVAGTSGVLWHSDGRVWSYEETGARQRINSLQLTTGPGGARTLWLLGDNGSVLRKRLP